MFFFIKVFDCFCSKLTRVAELFVFFSIQRRTLLSFFFFLLTSTEAGKMALSQTKQPPGNGQSPAKKFKLATVRANQQPAAASSPRIVTMTADQFLALAGRLQQSKGGRFSWKFLPFLQYSTPHLSNIALVFMAHHMFLSRL